MFTVRLLAQRASCPSSAVMTFAFGDRRCTQLQAEAIVPCVGVRNARSAAILRQDRSLFVSGYGFADTYDDQAFPPSWPRSCRAIARAIA